MQPPLVLLQSGTYRCGQAARRDRPLRSVETAHKNYLSCCNLARPYFDSVTHVAESAHSRVAGPLSALSGCFPAEPVTGG